MNRLSLLICLLGIGSASMKLIKPFRPCHNTPQRYPRSCLQIKRTAPRALSGLYDIRVANSIVTVYCEMALHGGGFTFIPRNAVRKGKLPTLVRQLFTQKDQVLLRHQRINGIQPHTLIRQLPGRNFNLGLRMHNFFGYTKPLNAYMRDYLFLGILPNRVAKPRNLQGFASNGKQVTFKNCDANPNSYFAFFPNHHERPISNYLGGNRIFERAGVAVKWRKTGIPSFAHRRLPNDFFFLTEMHFGGCGCYTSSDRWQPPASPSGTAIGVR